jgi:hypothetical protein
VSGGINSKVFMQQCDSATNHANLWRLDTDGLLHNQAVQASQKVDLCLWLDIKEYPPTPPTNVSSVIVDGSKTSALPHFWSRCVGSSHGAMWLRSDWLKHLGMAKQLGDFHFVRGHGMLDEDVQCYSTGQSYYNAIRAYSNVLSVGMKPLVELSYTPNPLASTSSTAFHYKGNNSPPKDMAAYGKLVRDFVQALVDYFGEEEVMV